MSGTKVIEAAQFGFVPSAGSVLADWGADVIKLEHPIGGDPIRSMVAWGIEPGVGGGNFLWEVFNRGKRAIGLDLRAPEGRDVLLSMVEKADVFLTNFLPDARRKLRIDAADLMNSNPGLVYACGSAHGPEAESGGFDAITYWSGSGASLSARPAGHQDPIPMPGPGFGDIQAGSQLAGAIAAALYRRERTGSGCVVDHSLLASGLWAMQPSIAGADVAGVDQLPPVDRRRPDTPLGTWYQTADARWVFLGFNDPDRYWATFCPLIDRLDLLTDPRFATHEARMVHLEATVELLEGIFAERTLAEWTTILSAQAGPWAIHRTPIEAAYSVQATANGYVQSIAFGDRGTLKLVSAPGQFDREPAELSPGPSHAQHTYEVLQEFGWQMPALEHLAESKVIMQSNPLERSADKE